MRDESDFAAYVAARWPALVRTLVLLGAPPRAAEDVALTALSHCHARWERLVDSDDLDVAVYRTVLEHWSRRRWDERSADPPDGVLLEAELEAELDRLTPGLRAVLVLRSVAGLSEAQVADVLDRPPAERDPTRPGLPDGEAVREAAERLDVHAAPIEAAMARADGHRRRRRVGTAAGVGVLAAAVALGTWIGTRGDSAPTDLAVAPVTLTENPAPVGWWADNALHLEHVRIELPPVTDLAEVAGGAVYADEEGRVVFVGDDGTRDVLGQTEPGAPVVVSDAQGWAVWTERRDDFAELVVFDLGARVVVGAVAGDAGLRVVAIDQRRVFYSTPDGSFGWSPPDGGSVREPSGLLDVASAVRVRQSAEDRIEIVQPFFSINFVFPGVGAELSPDGDYVLTRAPDPGSSYGTVDIYDTRSGDEISTGLTEADVAIGARLGEERTVTYVVARAEDEPDADGGSSRLSFSGPIELRTCSFDTGQCVVDAQFPSTGSLPVLAR